MRKYTEIEISEMNDAQFEALITQYEKENGKHPYIETYRMLSKDGAETEDLLRMLQIGEEVGALKNRIGEVIAGS